MEMSFQPIEGYVYGAIQPSALLRFPRNGFTQEALATSFKKLSESLSELGSFSIFNPGEFAFDPQSAPSWLLLMLANLNGYCGDHRFTSIKVFEEEASLVYALPTLSPDLTFYNLQATQLFLRNATPSFSKEDVIRFADKQKQDCRRFLPKGTNASSFIIAAAEQKTPFKIFSEQYLIFGYGAGSTIFNSSMTSRESAIGVGLSKNKAVCNQFLRMSGFPVAHQAGVRSPEDAVRFAQKFGYPVVIKPVNEDQGRGVYPYIRDETELRKKIQDISGVYQFLIIENHVTGDGYRVYVYDGEVIRALKRIAAHVIGDGVSSIEALIQAENKNPLRHGKERNIDQIVIDADLHEALEKQAVELATIPEAGQKIVLRYMTNISRGGTEVDFLAMLHPDTISLCQDVAGTLGLNCAGIDLISEDASKSWRDNNTIICEVNGQPQIGRRKLDMHSKMLHGELGALPEIRLRIEPDASPDFSIFNKTERCLELVLPPEFILNRGSPTQYFNSLEISDQISAEVRAKLEEMLVSVMPE